MSGKKKNNDYQSRLAKRGKENFDNANKNKLTQSLAGLAFYNHNLIKNQ